ncbi:cache domain-containing protein [Mycolicibacterium sphagni]|uniref:Cache domain-containing protein n=1 Tax=Mycolicibacterium sphagni TaxID=1786 RepID=A0ABX2K036_9MYCO|nr:cache domain-containing protein [Mycolicibacterium sphagni]NTY60451.1 hypothetical protein [Mycolicibacterium sphagni]
MNHPSGDAHDAALDGVTKAVSAMVERIFTTLDAIGSELSSLWNRLEASDVRPRSTDLGVLRNVVIAELQQHSRLLNGAGLVIAEDRLADSRRHVEWWRPDPGRGVSNRVKLDLNPQSEYFYDYSTMAWFAGPRDHGTRWIHGPYLDFTCADLNVCTLAVPVTSRGGAFLGIAGADAPVARIDAELLPKFQTSGHLLALVNAEGRIIVANHVDYVGGSRIKVPHGTRPAWPVPATTWTLISLD